MKQEKVFSLSRVALAAPSRNITLLFEELYCLLLVAGLYVEARDDKSSRAIPINTAGMDDKDFGIPTGSYINGLSRMISQALRARYTMLWHHADINPREKDILSFIGKLFVDDAAWILPLKGTDLYGIALARSFSPAMASVARYVSVMYGHDTFAEETPVPKLYISGLGNIYLSESTTVILGTPELPYGTSMCGTKVTALWSLLSAQLTSIALDPSPGDNLAETLTGLRFLSEPCQFEKTIPAPVYASSLHMKQMMGMDDYNPVAPAAAFYQHFLYGSIEQQCISRYSLLKYLLDLMVKKSGQPSVFDLFANGSSFTKLASTIKIPDKTPKHPLVLRFALEALADDTDESTDTTLPDDDSSSDDSTADPDAQTTSVTDGGYDPTNPAPVTMDEPIVAKNTIGLLSFDKSGEGVDEELYRQAIIALNDRLREDDTLPVSTEVREALAHWVNGFLYLTAISSTKNYMVALKLQQYLKKF